VSSFIVLFDAKLRSRTQNQEELKLFLGAFGATSASWQGEQCWYCVASQSPNGRRDTVAEASNLLILFDGWLENRDELIDVLCRERRADVLDNEIVALAYRKWGDQIASHLYGEHAIIIWDIQLGSVLAIRDKVGVRPLYYATLSQGIAFATYPGALSLLNEVGDEYDEGALGEFLCGVEHAHTDTIYKNVKRLQGGHFLRWKPGQPHYISRYWIPDHEIYQQPIDEFIEALRFQITSSVRAASRSETVIGCEVSGGIDSSTVALVLGQLQREGQNVCPSVEAHSLVYPGYNCDESVFIAAVQDVLPYKIRLHVNAYPSISEQYASIRRLRYPYRMLDCQNRDTALRQQGVRVILTGHGGDELFYPTEHAFHLALRTWAGIQRTGDLIYRNFRKMPTTQRIARRTYTSIQEVVGHRLQRLVHDLRSYQSRSWPICNEWIDAINLRSRSRPRAVPSNARVLGVDLAMTGYLSAVHEWMAMNTRPQGFEYRHPLSSARLLELTNRTPFALMDTISPKTRWPMRLAFAKLLPALIANRTDKAEFSRPTIDGLARLWKVTIAEQDANRDVSKLPPRKERSYRAMANGVRIWEPLAALAVHQWVQLGLTSHPDGVPQLLNDQDE
jgi:asparagine synthase (glutamine-hydrolysing)